ncbi:MAG: sigma-54 dependent transcriptional regulator [Bryobacteraceae bacterium]|jgi:DNA-binding NtrC family response regulator
MNATKILWIRGNQEGPAAEFGGRAATWTVEYLDGPIGIERLPRQDYGAIVLDFPIPDWTPAALMEQVHRLAPAVPVLVRDPSATLNDAVRLTRLGIHQFLAPPGEEHLQIERALEQRRTHSLAQLASRAGLEDWERLLVGDSREMRQVSNLIRLVGARRATVLITGETGTGKELAARALHLAGPRRQAPWVAVNCSALPENLLEAELFGHVRGAFTGAVQSRLGRFEQAQGGTLFLDEIGELPLELQAKLLRVLQEREFQRLGSSETIRCDARVIAASNSDLPQRIEQRRFREDLFYRLNVVPIRMPALRQRPGDVPALALHFVEKICRQEEIPPKTIAPEAAERLCAQSWPGNVRQLENAIEMAVALSGDRDVLVPGDFPLPLQDRAAICARPGATPPLVPVPDDGLDYERTVALIERSILDQALRKTGGNKKAAADMLRLKRTTLSAKVRSLEPAACD